MRTHLTLMVLSLALLALTGCAGGATESPGESHSDEEYAEAMATEHAEDEPVASGAATGEASGEVRTEEVVYASVDGHEVTGYLARPAGEEKAPGLIVIHEWWGLNDNIRTMAERFAAEGYAALAVDLYGGRVGETPEEAREIMQSLDEATAEANLRQAYDYLTTTVGASEVGTIGWCFGGGWSLRTALLLPEAIDATVIYYGRLVTDPERLEPLTMPILGIFGAEDQGIPVASVREFEGALEALGKDATIHVYEGAGHAFANPSGTRYVESAAEDAWAKTLEFFAQHLAG